MSGFIQQNYINPKLQIIGSAPYNRTEYLVAGEKMSVANYDRAKFEMSMNNYLNASEKYYNFKQQHPLETFLISMANLGMIIGGTAAGVCLSNHLTKNCSKVLKYASGIFAGILSLGISGTITSHTAIPGRKEMRDAKKMFATIDVAPALNNPNLKS